MKIKRKKRLRNSFKDIKELLEPQSIAIVGYEGSGKTSLLTAFNIIDRRKNYKTRLKNSCEKVNYLKNLGYKKVNLPTNFYHSNVKILFFDNVCSGFTTFDKFGLQTGKNIVDNYPFYSLLSYDEPEGDIDSRDYKNFDSDAQYGGLKLKRHKGLTLIMCLHNPNNIEKRVRENFRKIIFIYDRTTKSFLGLFKRTTWYTREYYINYGLEFLKMGFTGEIPKDQLLYNFIHWKRYTFWGNIYKHYDPTAFAPNWYVNDEFCDNEHLTSHPTLDELPNHRQMYGYGKQKTMNVNLNKED